MGREARLDQSRLDAVLCPGADRAPGSDPGSPQTREYTGAYHFGHTADPVYVGTCNGATASCSYAGYAMESACHTGRECVYDVVAEAATKKQFYQEADAL